MKKIASRLAYLIPAAAAAVVLVFSSVGTSHAELQGVGGGSLPPPPPKCTGTVIGVTSNGMLILSNGTVVAPDGTTAVLQ